MTDENKDRDAGSASLHELAETPFGGYKPGSPEEPEAEQAQPEESLPAEEPDTAPAAEEPSIDDAIPVVEEEAAMSMEEAMAAYPPGDSKSTGAPDYSQTFRKLMAGDVVPGTVVHIDKEGVLVDVGTKSEGVIRMQELAREAFHDPEEIVQVGQTISVYVMNSETDEGNLLLSKKTCGFRRSLE